jgi:MFS family permease
LRNHPLIRTLINLRGNVRGCVYTEVLWGIPFNLYAPYVSIYMLTLGLADSQIGLLTTIGLAFQVFATLMSGSIADKLGRKRTTLIFDILSWSVPSVIWAVARDFRYFLVAAIVNSVWRIVDNSWRLLLVEDTDPRLLVDVWSWISISNLAVGFVAPVTGLLISRFSLVPTMRGLYWLGVVMMTSKFLIMNSMVTETRQGLVRMKETHHQHLFSVLQGSTGVLKQILHAPATILVGGVMTTVSITMMIQRTFWSILITEKLHIPAEHLVIYTFARSATMLLFFFLAMPRLRHVRSHKPMMVGLLGMIVSQVILLNVPAGNYILLLVATILEACSFPLINTLLEKLIVLSVDAKERSRIMALLNMMVLSFTSPFGWIAGQLSGMNRSLPFVLSICLFAVGGLLIYLASRFSKEPPAAVEIAEPTAQA